MDAIAQMEEINGKKFGDKENPLLVSVRSGARASMPGMMDTILNLGLNEEVVHTIAEKSGMTKVDAKKALDATIEAITAALKGGDKVSLVGFGTLSVNERAARKGRNPQTKKEMMIPAKKVVKFKAGADLANL